MSSDAKKLELIELIIKMDNDELLDEIKDVIANGKAISPPKKRNLLDFVVIFTEEEAEEMRKVIEEGWGKASIKQMP